MNWDSIPKEERAIFTTDTSKAQQYVSFVGAYKRFLLCREVYTDLRITCLVVSDSARPRNPRMDTGTT